MNERLVVGPAVRRPVYGYRLRLHHVPAVRQPLSGPRSPCRLPGALDGVQRNGDVAAESRLENDELLVAGTDRGVSRFEEAFLE
ncbi:hypothetical protein [Natronococcus wangiae]|uniref:hypothetical protein n=1 Tax=Natronococcus wangiae TaxID=3068275 RepID=UPI00273E724B|nr:hypothetical protein [Natronococcus sp. AD5]